MSQVKKKNQSRFSLRVKSSDCGSFAVVCIIYLIQFNRRLVTLTSSSFLGYLILSSPGALFGRALHDPRSGKMKDPGNEVVFTFGSSKEGAYFKL